MKSALIVLGALIGSPFACYAMQHENDLSIVESASYYVVQGTEQKIIGGIPGGAQYATFYDAEGNELKKVDKKECDLFNLIDKLDPKAPKPKPASYAIKYWPAIDLGGGMKEGKPGYFIVFVDKNGNYIGRYRYNVKRRDIAVAHEPATQTIHVLNINSIALLKDFDATACIEKDSDEIKDHSNDDQKQNSGWCSLT